MESRIKVLMVLMVLGTANIIFPNQMKAQQANVSFQVFYDQLSPFGQWINYSNYGYVWLPNEGSDFVPYSTAGHWIYTEYGWTWVSDYNWGWAPFHYGRWDFDNFYGWMWIPDNEWGPSWVTWRRGNGYYGWEPMGPGITISMSFGRPYNSHNDHWMFVRDRDFERTDMNHYYVSRNEHNTIIQNTIIINKTYIDSKRRTSYLAGPAREDVQKGTGRKVTQVSIQENSSPGQVSGNGQLRIYRPVVNKGNNSSKTIAPSKIVVLKDVKKYTERSTKTQAQKTTQNDNTKKDRTPLSVKPSKNYEKNSQVSNQGGSSQGTGIKQNKPKYTVAAANKTVLKDQPQKKETVAVTNKNVVKEQPQRKQTVVAAPENNNVKSQPIRQQNTVPQVNKVTNSNPVGQQNAQRRNNNVRSNAPGNTQPANNSNKEQPKVNQERKQ